MAIPSKLCVRMTVRLSPALGRVIEQSGEGGPEWLRKAAQIRIERENQKDTLLGAVQGQLKSLQAHVDELTAALKNVQGEIGKAHGSVIGAETQVRALAQVVTFVRQNQLELSGVLTQMDKNVSHAVTQLGPSLLVVLSQQLRDLIHAETEQKERPKNRPPLYPRTSL